MEVLWLCESLKSIGRPIRHQQKNLMCSCASGQPTESGKEARLWKGIQPFWHCAGESGYIGLFLVALLEGHWRIMDFGVTWNWLESYLYCLLNLGNSFTSEPCVWIEWDDIQSHWGVCMHRISLPGILLTIICDVTQGYLPNSFSLSCLFPVADCRMIMCMNPDSEF